MMQGARLMSQQAKLTDQASAKTGKEKLPARVTKGFRAQAPRTAILEVPPARPTASRSTGHSGERHLSSWGLQASSRVQSAETKRGCEQGGWSGRMGAALRWLLDPEGRRST